MAKKAIQPTCKLETAYVLPDVSGVITNAEYNRLFGLLDGSGVDIGNDTLKIVIYANTEQQHQYETQVQITLTGASSSNNCIDILFSGPSLHGQFHVANYSNSNVTAYHWYALDYDTFNWVEISTEQTINVNSTENGVTSYTDNVGRAFSINQELNAQLLPYVYMKDDTPEPEPTTEDERLKTYMARLKKFITLQQGKKISQGE